MQMQCADTQQKQEGSKQEGVQAEQGVQAERAHPEVVSSALTTPCSSSSVPSPGRRGPAACSQIPMSHWIPAEAVTCKTMHLQSF